MVAAVAKQPTTQQAPGMPGAAGAQSGLSKRQLYLKRWTKLKSERATWDGDWRDLVDYLHPYGGRFTPDETNQGGKSARASKQLHTAARRSLKVLAAGLMGGMTSPARPWFRLTTGHIDLREDAEVKRWFQQVTDLMREIFAQSNTYRALHQAYVELGAFGTSLTVAMPDFENVIHLFPITVGEYALACDNKGKVDTFAREFNMTVGQIVQQFEWANISPMVKDHWGRGNVDQWIPVQHVVEPNAGRDMEKRDASGMRFRSCYYESSRGVDDKLLAEEGFNRFPGLAARWDVNGNDVYGTGPGHDALKDMKEANFFKSRRALAIDYMSNPPVQVPGILRSVGVNRFPGGTTFVDQTGPENSIRSMFDVQLNLQHLDGAMQETLSLIKSHFYEDLFLMLANDTRSGTTATEVAERHEEKLLMLGPVLERLHNELLDPLINFTFERMVESRILPPPPLKLQGKDVKVQYVSVLAQAQRAVGLASFDRLIATVGAVAGAAQDPSVWDKIDKDQLIDEYADGLGVTPSIIRSDDQVAALRQQRQKQQDQQQALAGAQQAAETAATASKADPARLQDVMGMFSGYGSPSPVEVGAQ
jgi:hypothetical protein